MRPLRIRSLLTAAAGFAALPIVGPLMLAMRSELEAALDRGDRAEAEADAASLRADRDRQDLADTKSLWESSNRIVAAQMAKAKADIDSLKALALAANDRAEQWARAQRDAAGHLARCAEMVDERDATIRGLQNDLGVVSGERDAARKERDDLALRLAAETERCEALLFAANMVRSPAKPDPVRDWPQPGVSEEDACDYCGNTRGLGLKAESYSVCGKCYYGCTSSAIRARADARKALKSSAATPKSST